VAAKSVFIGELFAARRRTAAPRASSATRHDALIVGF
jgi:hypothetical protein